jgi:hypothetical protein
MPMYNLSICEVVRFEDIKKGSLLEQKGLPLIFASLEISFLTQVTKY